MVSQGWDVKQIPGQTSFYLLGLSDAAKKKKLESIKMLIEHRLCMLDP